MGLDATGLFPGPKHCSTPYVAAAPTVEHRMTNRRQHSPNDGLHRPHEFSIARPLSHADRPKRHQVGGRALTVAPRTATATARDGTGDEPGTATPGESNTSGDGEGAGPTGAARPRRTTPNWLTGDGVVGRAPDRQILVVGTDVSGLTLAGLLDRAGFDPVVVAGTEATVDASVGSALTLLWPPSLRVLDALGVGAAVRERGYESEGVAVERTTRATDAPHSSSTPPSPSPSPLARAPDGDVAAPLVVGTGDLRQVFREHVAERLAIQHRGVADVSRSGDALAVEFADGVTEWFDVVALAGSEAGTLRQADDGPAPGATLTQYEVTLDGAATPERDLAESWFPDAVVQRLPRPDGTGQLLRVTTTRSELPSALSGAQPAESVAGIAPASLPATAEWPDPTAVRQTKLRRSGVAPGWWGTDRVARCGRGAVQVAPATGLAVSLGVEDAWALAASLARDARSVSNAVDTYAHRRTRWLRTVRGRVARAAPDSQYPIPDWPSPAGSRPVSSGESADGSAGSPPAGDFPSSSLATVASLRAVALGAFAGPSLAALQRDLDDRL